MEFKIKNKVLDFKTKKGYDFIDFTEKVEAAIKESGIKDGLVNVQSWHTTAAILINENEPLLISDLKKNFQQIARKNIKYAHDDFSIRTVNMCSDECKNGHSHCLAAYLPTSITLNLQDGKLQFGHWQRIFLIELDRARDRKVSVQVMGG